MLFIPSTDLSGTRLAGDDSDSGDEFLNQHRLNIAEAFADDDVVQEFNQQRKRESAVAGL